MNKTFSKAVVGGTSLEFMENAQRAILFLSLSIVFLIGTYFVDFAGRIVFLGKGGDAQQASQSELKGVGYYQKCC